MKLNKSYWPPKRFNLKTKSSGARNLNKHSHSQCLLYDALYFTPPGDPSIQSHLLHHCSTLPLIAKRCNIHLRWFIPTFREKGSEKYIHEWQLHLYSSRSLQIYMFMNHSTFFILFEDDALNFRIWFSNQIFWLNIVKIQKIFHRQGMFSHCAQWMWILCAACYILCTCYSYMFYTCLWYFYIPFPNLTWRLGLWSQKGRK